MNAIMKFLGLCQPQYRWTFESKHGIVGMSIEGTEKQTLSAREMPLDFGFYLVSKELL